MTSRRVLWLTPDKPANISIGRQRIASHLERSGIEVVLRGTTVRTLADSIRDRQRFDAVIGTTRAGAIAGVTVSVAKRCPLIVDHVDPIRQLEETEPQPFATLVRWLENAAFALADHVLYVYPEERARVERFATRATKTDLGVDFDRFAEPAPEAIRAAETRLDGVDLDERVAVYLGGLEPIYHVRTLLESVRHLEGWTLLVIGDGSLADRVERAATRNEQVAFLGGVPHEEVPGYLRAANVGVCLVDDPYTLKVLEYGAAGLPVVQLAGRAADRFGGLVEFCTTDPADVARAIEAANDGAIEADRTDRTDRNPRQDRGSREDLEDREDRKGNPESLRAFAKRFDWAEIAADYERVLKDVT